MEKKFDAVCIGTCLMDISTAGLDFDTFLENEPNLASSITYCGGGDAINESTVLSRLGFRVAFMSRVGDDFIGRHLMEQAAENGVDVSGVRAVPGCPTAANNILIGSNDKRVYTISKNATSRTEFCVDDLDLDYVKDTKLVAFGSIFVHDKFDDAAYTRIFRTAKEHGAITCADVCPSGQDCSLENLKEAMQYLDYFFANESEAEYLSGKIDPDEMADYFLDLGIGTVIIKFGGKGSLVKNREKRFMQQPFYVEPVDTTGAGDCYAAGFMSGLIRGLPLEECAEFASVAGALAVQKVGATAGIESMEQARRFLEEQRSKKQAWN